MSDLACRIAGEARRVGLLRVLWERREQLTLERLERLLRCDVFGDLLAAITLDELRAAQPDGAGLAIRRGESVEDAILRVFRTRPVVWLRSGFFIERMGLPRWTVQALLADLVERGQLVRCGRTSSTRYRLADESSAQGALRRS